MAIDVVQPAGSARTLQLRSELQHCVVDAGDVHVHVYMLQGIILEMHPYGYPPNVA